MPRHGVVWSRWGIVFLVLVGAARLAAQAYTFTKYSGTTLDSIGMGVAGLAPSSMVFDSAGNLFLDDRNNNTIRRVSPAGEMTVYAGTVHNTTPDALIGTNGLGTAVQFNHPAIAGFDRLGNLLVYDGASGTMRQIAPNGLVTTRASVNAPNYTSSPLAAMDAAGNVFVADYYGVQVKKIAPDGTVSTVLPAGQVHLNTNVYGIAVDATDNVYLALDDSTIRRVAPDGTITVWAGTPGTKGTADGPRASALFNIPGSMVADSDGNLYVADFNNCTVRRISAAGTVTTVAGLAGTAGTADGVGSAARFGSPWALSLHPSGLIYLFDQGTASIRTLSPAGDVHTLVTNLNAADGPLATAFFNSPLHLAADAAGNLYVSEVHTIRKISPAGIVSTLYGNVGAWASSLPPTAAPTLVGPAGLTPDGAGGAYVADYGASTIDHVGADGTLTIVAGSPNLTGTADGVGTSARFNRPQGVVRDSSGNLFVTDSGNYVVRKIAPDGTVTLFAGVVGVPGIADSAGGPAQFKQLTGIAVDPLNNVYVADNFAIRKITPAGVVTTLAGMPGQGGSADGTGAAARFGGTDSIFNGIADIAADGSGTVFVADNGNHTVRKVTLGGAVTTIGGMAGASGNAPGTGSAARFSGVSGIAVDPSGNLYVTQNGSNDYTIHRAVPTSNPPTFTMQPPSLVVAPGSTVVLGVDASAAETLQWYRNGTLISGATTNRLSITGAGAVNTGVFTVAATNANGATTSSAANVTPTATANPGRFVNVSVRAPANRSEILTVGFVTGGAGTAGSESLLVRGLGPALLPFGVTDYTPDPLLNVYLQATGDFIAANDNWAGDPTVAAADAAFTGLPLTDPASTDAAMVLSLPGTAYSAEVTGKTDQSGQVLAEVYDATADRTVATPRLVNVSTRAAIALNGTLTIGFVIAGDTARTVLVRVVGPSLSPLGVSDFMPDPRLAMFTGQTRLFQNSAWGGDSLIKSTASAVGAFPITNASSHDAAILVTLPPGGYTVQANSESGSPGTAIIEAYEVQ